MRERWHFDTVVHTIMVLVHMGLSLVFIVSDDPRFSSASWKPLGTAIDGQWWLWGVVLGGAGLGMALFHDHLRLDLAFTFIAMCWMWMMAALFIVALKDPAASATGPVAYTGFAALNAALLTQRIMDWLRERPASNRG